jgi:hypothetical protein
MPTTMSPARARGTRRPQLEADVAAARKPCVTSDEDWLRKTDEDSTSWTIRRQGLARTCASCPVLAQCQELALRDATTAYMDDDMVIGGLTPPELAVVRRSDQHRRSLLMAIAADQASARAADEVDRERAEINQLARRLAYTASTVKRRHTERSCRQKNNQQVRALADALSARRAARRERNGWTKAA